MVDSSEKGCERTVSVRDGRQKAVDPPADLIYLPQFPCGVAVRTATGGLGRCCLVSDESQGLWRGERGVREMKVTKFVILVHREMVWKE